ncbi:MAG: carbonic anhydrase [Bacteroidaceae bacterium]|nr:carbonic anhydrase [Bacteroidaceae bacterium]
MIDQILEYNKSFVAQRSYEKYLTDKYPDKKLAVLSCMDTRLTELLPAALGLKNGDAKIIKNAGGLVISPFDSAIRSLIVAIYELGVEEIMVVAHSNCGACHMSFSHFHEEMTRRGVTDETLDVIRKCGIDLDSWLEGFKDTPTSVRKTVETIKTHPLIPEDVVVRGFIIDSVTGALEEITEEQ